MSRLPILVTLTFRPEFQHAWSGQPHVSMLALNRLGEGDGVALVERLAGNAGLSREIVDEIVERGDGVPLFVEELTKAVLASGERENRVAAVLATSPLPSLAIPATLHASLIARLDRLGPVAKEVAQIGAVIGREFSYELIQPVAQRPEPDLETALDRLTNAGLLFCRGVPPHSSYLFKHALVQDAAYATLLRVRPPAAACRHRCGTRTGISRDCRSPARAARSSLYRGRPDAAGHRQLAPRWRTRDRRLGKPRSHRRGARSCRADRHCVLRGRVASARRPTSVVPRSGGRAQSRSLLSSRGRE